MVVADGELHAGEAALLNRVRKSFQLLVLSRWASSTARIWRRPFQLMPIAISTAWLRIMPSMRTFSQRALASVN